MRTAIPEARPQLRRAAADELALLSHLHATHLWLDPGEDADEAAALLALMRPVYRRMAAEGAFFVAHSDGEIIGAGGWEPMVGSAATAALSGKPGWAAWRDRTALLWMLFAPRTPGLAVMRWTIAAAEADAAAAGYNFADAVLPERVSAGFRIAGYSEIGMLHLPGGPELAHLSRALPLALPAVA